MRSLLILALSSLTSVAHDARTGRLRFSAFDGTRPGV
jgi:hypothetical protein